METSVQSDADEISAVAEAIGDAIVEQSGGEVDVYVLLSALITVAGAVIRQVPTEARGDLIAAWDEALRSARADLALLN